jgi:hypothetical protein
MIERTTLRIVLPSPDAQAPTPARVFRVADDGTELELREVSSIDIRVRPDEVITARVVLDAYVAAPPRFCLVVDGTLVRPSLFARVSRWFRTRT